MRSHRLNGYTVISKILRGLFVVPCYLQSTVPGRLQRACCSAFATSTQSRRVPVPLSCTIVRAPISGLTTLYDSSDRINGEGSKPKQDTTAETNETQLQQRAQTGWNHNLPDKQSDFWKGPRDEKKYRSTTTSSDSSSSSKRELRTGWLHNSVSNKKPTSPEMTKSSSTSTDSSGKDTGSSKDLQLARRRLELAKTQQQRNHRIVSPPTFHACGDDCVVVTTEHLISVPVYHNNNRPPESAGDNSLQQERNEKRIDVYFCIVETLPNEASRVFFQHVLGGSNTILTPNQRALKYVEFASLKNADDMVLYLQGGPGFGAPTPAVSLGLTKGCGSWADAALHELGYRRIVLMDQRGTGKSTPITKQTLEQLFPDLFQLDHLVPPHDGNITIDEFLSTRPDDASKVQSAADQVTEYLSQFRADNIVQDAEFIREALMEPSLEDESFKDDRFLSNDLSIASQQSTEDNAIYRWNRTYAIGHSRSL